MNAARDLRNSAVAVLCGWLAGAACFLVYLPWAFVYMVGYVVPAWLFFVVPHYVFLPRTSILWSRWICPIYGAVWGVAILALYAKIGYRGYPSFVYATELLTPWFLIAAGVTGFITCLTASAQKDAE